MRTTLSIDDDVLVAVKERARQQGRTAGEVLSDLAREALTARRGAEPRDERNGLALLPSRRAVVTEALIERIRDDEGV